MSNFQQKDNSGALFRNDRKEQDSQPDYRGSAFIAGVEYWAAGWIKQSKAGATYMSLSYQPKEAQQDYGGSNDDFPF